MQPVRARFIPHAPRSGPENMAIDECMVSWYGRAGTPLFRVYSWSPPAISLGRYQKSDCLDLEACRADGVDIVRRITGGGAIYHDRELTYSLVCGADDLDGRPLTVPESFKTVNRFLILFYRRAGLHASYSADGPPPAPVMGRAEFCFSGNERYDILIDRKKIGGNAQRRLGKAILQHGSIPLSIDRDRIARYFKAGPGRDNFTSLAELACGEMKAEEGARLLAECFSETAGVRLCREDLGPGEKAEIESIMKDRYLDRRWNLEGRDERDEAAAAAMA